jgi:hypothetical protein
MLPGLGSRSIEFLSGPALELVESHDALERLMAFAGVTREDLARCEFARRKLSIYLDIRSEMESLWLCDELERQWNPLGRRG